jgi:hypothetical protein
MKTKKYHTVRIYYSSIEFMVTTLFLWFYMYLKVDILLTCGKHLQDRISSLKTKVWSHTTNLSSLPLSACTESGVKHHNPNPIEKSKKEAKSITLTQICMTADVSGLVHALNGNEDKLVVWDQTTVRTVWYFLVFILLHTTHSGYITS